MLPPYAASSDWQPTGGRQKTAGKWSDDDDGWLTA
jgi:hypothetical protein